MRRIAEARVKTGAFIARLMMVYAGFAAFCAFTLFSPDRPMLDPQASLNMPFAGTVSFQAFMLVAPVVLIVMRVYLGVYVERWRHLDAELDPETEPETISPLKHPLLRRFSALLLYFLLPAMLALFTWKAAAKDLWKDVWRDLWRDHLRNIWQDVRLEVWLYFGGDWGNPMVIRRDAFSFLTLGDAFLLLTLVCATAQVYAFIRRPWFSRAAQIAVVSGLLFAVGLSAGGIPHRGLNLAREDLKATYLIGEDLRNANLFRANLTDANLIVADFTDANLWEADLTRADLGSATFTDADLTFARLTGADLGDARFRRANLWSADLTDANLSDADFTGAQYLKQHQLDSACISKGGELPTLPEGLKPPQKECVPRLPRLP